MTPTEQDSTETGAGEVELTTIGFREFLPTAEDIVDARHFVRQRLEEVGAGPDLVSAAELVADEFAANAVEFAGSYFSVSIGVDGRRVRIAVRDDSGVFPQLRAHAVEALSGRGLSIVAMTAEQWGTESLGRGKEVWADLHP